MFVTQVIAPNFKLITLYTFFPPVFILSVSNHAWHETGWHMPSEPYGHSVSLFPAWGSSGSWRARKASRSLKRTVGAHRFSVWVSPANMLQLNTQSALVPPCPVPNRDGNRGPMYLHQLSLAHKLS